MNSKRQVVMITGTRKGIGKGLVEYYTQTDCQVLGCSRRPVDFAFDNYQHYCLDVSDETSVKETFSKIRQTYGCLDVLINNAGIASMNHSMLTPIDTVVRVLNTNVVGTFLFCREAAKLMKQSKYGRIVNFTTAAVPLKLAGEAIYASSKAAIVTLTQVLAKEFADFDITVNAVGPTPVKTDLINPVSKEQLANVLEQQAINRFSEIKDITNVIEFFIRPESDFITGQVIYLGGL